MAQDHDSIACAIEFLSERPCAFTLSELQESLNYSIDEATILFSLGNHPELLRLVNSENDQWFISRATLLRWLISINIRLARIGITQISEKHWRNTLSSIRLEGQWSTTPEAVVEFGSRLCLVQDSRFTGGVVFPLAAVLSRIPEHRFGIDDLHVLLTPFFNTHRDQDPLNTTVDKFLHAHFPERIVDIIKGREGLNGQNVATLAELGSHLGLSRERVRQIGAKFWKAITPPFHSRDRTTGHRLRKELMHIFLSDLVRRRGGLVWQPTDAAFPYRVFIAKCLGLPIWHHPQIDILVAGSDQNNPISVLLSKSLQITELSTPLEAFRQQMASLACGLIDHDIISLTEFAIQRQRAGLNKIERVYLALRAIGQPAHYREVAKKYNTIFPEDKSSDRNIHAALNRRELGIVWVGRRGTFALEEWGFRQPEKGLYETVTDIVIAEYRRKQ